jgi:hypothetical protein
MTVQLSAIEQPLVLKDGISPALDKLTAKAKQAGASLDKDLSGGAKKAGDQMGKTAGDAQRLTVGMGGFLKILGAAGAGKLIADFVRDLVRTSSELSDVSARVSVGVRDLQRLGEAAKRGGGDIHTVGSAMDAMAKNVVAGSGEASKALGRIGLTVGQLQGLKPAESFERIAEAIRKTKDPMVQADAAMRIFGASGAELLPGIREGVVEIGDEAEKLGLILGDRTVRNMDAVGKAWERVRTQLQVGLGNVLGDTLSVVNAFTAMIPKFERLVDLATKFGALRIYGAVTKWAADAVDRSKWSEKMDADAARLAGERGGLPAAVNDFGFAFSEEEQKKIERELDRQLKTVTRNNEQLDRAAEERRRIAQRAVQALAEASAKTMGVDLIEQASLAAHAFDQAKQAGIALSKEALQKINADMRAGNEAAERLVGFVPGAWREIAAATEPAIEATQKYRQQWVLLPTTIKGVQSEVIRFRAAWEALGLTKQADIILSIRNAMNGWLGGVLRMHPAMDGLLERLGLLGGQARDVGETLGDKIKSGVGTAISEIPLLLRQAFAGGGGIMGAVKALGVQIAEAIMRPMVERMKAMGGRVSGSVSAGITGASAIGGAMGGNTGAMIAGTASAIGGAALATTALGVAAKTSMVAMVGLSAATLGIGAAAVGVYLLAKRFFTVSKEVKQARADIENFQQALHQSLTAQQRTEAAGRSWAATVIVVRDAYVRMGRSAAEAEAIVKQLWNDRDPEAARAAMAQISDVVGRFQQQLATANEQFGPLLAQSAELGRRLPAALLASLDKLREMGDLTEENARLLSGLAGQAEIDWTKMQEAAERYGIDVNSLGSQFQQLRLSDAARQIINDFDLLTAGGASVGGVLFGMQEEISALVQESLKFGTEIPANMKPWIDELARVGLLVDENGHAIADLSNLKVGEVMKTEFEKVTEALWELIRTLQGPLNGAIAGIPRDVDIDVNMRGTYTPPDRDPGYASGTIGRLGTWWKNFGAGTPTVLHGTEAVVRPDQAYAFAMDHLGGGVARAAQREGGSGPTIVQLVARQGGRVLADVLLEEEPYALQRAGVWR